MSNTRQPGYYWCKYNEDSLWAVYEFTGTGWYEMNEETFMQDEEFDEINETRIPAPDEHIDNEIIEWAKQGKTYSTGNNGTTH